MTDKELTEQLIKNCEANPFIDDQTIEALKASIAKGKGTKMLPIHQMTSRELQEQIQNEKATLEDLLIRKNQVESLIRILVQAQIIIDNK